MSDELDDPETNQNQSGRARKRSANQAYAVIPKKEQRSNPIRLESFEVGHPNPLFLQGANMCDYILDLRIGKLAPVGWHLRLPVLGYRNQVIV
jgi:hypothetical protein